MAAGRNSVVQSGFPGAGRTVLHTAGACGCDEVFLFINRIQMVGMKSEIKHTLQPGKRQEEDYYISPGDKGKIKSLVCFEIAPEYRGRGIAKALLRRVCKDAEAEGFEYIEVYPQTSETYSPLAFNGPMAMYQYFGFEKIQQQGKTIVMRKKLSSC